MLKKASGTVDTGMGGDEGIVKRFFGAHAGSYARSQSHAHGSDLGALIEALKPKASDRALDVATGTGFTAVALAPRVNRVTGIDLTNEMLDEARKLARGEGIGNIGFEPGDAIAMKFADSSFDIVTTRRATHHFHDVPKFLREAYRVLGPGGRLGVVDMSPPEGAEVFSNKIEKLRDSSHVEAFTPGAWESMVSKAGFRILSTQILGEQVPFEKWLYPVEAGGREEKEIRKAWDTSGSEIRQLLQADFDGDVRRWTKSRIILVASK